MPTKSNLFSSLMFLIYLVGTRNLLPFVHENITTSIGGDIGCAVAMLLAMVPCTRLMHGSTKDALFTKLWLKHRANRLPLLTLRAIRIFIAACFMALVVRKIFHVLFALLVVIALIPVILIVRSQFIRGLAIDIELRFMSNFSQKTLAREKRERGGGNMRMINESLYVAEFKVLDLKKSVKVVDVTRRRGFHVTIIKIIHEDGDIVNLPLKNEMIRSRDVLHMMGTEEEIDAIMLLLAKRKTIEYTDKPDITLKDYIYGQTFRNIEADKQIFCIPIKVDSSMFFCRSSIRAAHLREAYRANIIGIERGNLPIISPDVETIIQEGDLMWVLGTKSTADKMIKAGLLEKPKKENIRRGV